MRFAQTLKDRLVRRICQRELRYLGKVSADELRRQSERRLLGTFRAAAARVPAYRDLLRARGVAPEAISSLAAFADRVPILDKKDLFQDRPVRDLCTGGDLAEAVAFYSSSGASGIFSYGAESRAQVRAAALGVECLLQMYFRALERKTLLVNGLPAGVRIPTSRVPVADTSVRWDAAVTLLKALKDDFDQFILVGEQEFLKRTLEEAEAAGLPWGEIVVHVVMGGEFVAENTRRYFQHILRADPARPEDGLVVLNMGLSELALSIFRDHPQLVRIRQLAQRDDGLRAALFGNDATVCPEILQYDPRQTYLETVPGADGMDRLVVSMLDRVRMLPMIRYNTGDRVRLLDYDSLAALLRQRGLDHLAPPCRLPVGIIWGKDEGIDSPDGRHIRVAEVKEALYSDFELAAAGSGNFRLVRDEAGVTLLVQASARVIPTPALEQGLGRCVAALAGPVNLRLLPYSSFPHGMELDLERKPRYV
jgi:phenylacetate-CoA ligase